MGDVKLKHLYMANNLKELNDMISNIPKSATPKRLVNSAQKLMKEAQSADSRKDEERAYVMYMTYFSAVKIIQKHSDYKVDKKYYDGLLDPKTTVKVITRAEEIAKSLERRYGFASGAMKAEEEEEEKLLDKLEREKEAKRVAEEQAKAKAKPAAATPAVSNGLVVDEGCMSCSKLYSLMREKCSTYLILDARPRDHFRESQMKLPNVINIPEEILRPGLTAVRIGNELDESGKTLWLTRRHEVDHLVLVDWETEHLPLPQPLQVLSDAMLKWDPGKEYKSLPWLLQGGYDLWRLMYPMHTTNSMVGRPPPSTQEPQEEALTLNFEYPNLDEAFNATPSPPPGTHQLPEAASRLTPQINRTLKPKVIEKELMDTRNNNTLDSNKASIPANNTLPAREDTLHRPTLGANINTWEIKDSNIVLEQQRAKLGPRPLPDKVDSISPFIPSRSLKPKDLLASLAANKKELEAEQELLEESMRIEEDTMKKMEEMEATSSKRETASDDHSRAQLQATEDKLREDIRKLEGKSLEMEERYNKIQRQNEELWKMVNLALAHQMNKVSISPAQPPEQEAEDRRQQEEQEALRKQKEQRRALQEQVERMRQERKEKERRLKEQAEREKRKQEEKEKLLRDRKAKDAEAERLRAEERRSKIDAETRAHRTKGFRGSPRSSPVRGGSNLRRSHSAFNLAQQEDEDERDDSVMPSFNRNLKPLATPQKRSINASRQRNFEPKYGSVPRAKTGLKNLGNSCYMNSIIQCLNNTKLLAKYFINGTCSEDINPNSKCKGNVAEEVGAVVRALWSGSYRSIAMWDLKNAVGIYHKPFQGYDQQDSHEFLLKLMDWLNEDLNQVREKRPPMKEQNHENVPEYVAANNVMKELLQRDNSVLCRLFHGLHRSTIQCNTCGHVSLTFEPFSVLSLSFPNSRKCSLWDLMHHYYKESSLEYRCSKCKKDRNCIRKMSIWKLPPVLVLHLNRFEHDVLMKKKQNYVDFPSENLDMTKFTCFDNRYTKFDLYAVCNHYGTMDGGHYTAFCRSPNSFKTWYKFDDHEVYELSDIKTPAAYLLFYEASNASEHILNSFV